MLYEGYDCVIDKPEMDDLMIQHYGVMGMRWGIRKDTRKGNGSISAKTKSKIKKGMDKTASYRKVKRRLNSVEQLKADYKGEIERWKNHKTKSYKAKNAQRTVNDLNKMTKDLESTAKKNGYKYNKKQGLRVTKRNQQATSLGYQLGGLIGGVSTMSFTQFADRSYRKKTGSVNSPYYVYDTNYYKTYKQKKK